MDVSQASELLQTLMWRRLSAAAARRCCFASTAVSRYTSFCVSTCVLQPAVSAVHHVCSVLAFTAPDAMQGEHFEVLLICFFHVCFKNQKYCSFKYCALHRIFCHKLVNIYIFQYSDIYFHIYRTIKCFCSLFFLLFRPLFFVFLEKSLRTYVDSCQVSTRASAVTVCLRKMSILNVWDNTAKPKQSAWRWQKITQQNEFWWRIWSFFSLEQMGEEACGGEE